ncbi:Hg(II)-responsive transcriptional regulator [Fonticella tunisiensis]|uniref:Mercuric resistance operon regulatory protein n=1 Tax=Fonticella tunisiensis TaxID=1096341 RepID=A0A4R7KTX9_9CLOT|nr:Hg(II)-responsive transcriptional regulator [Fonticella tunisiensis]TDT63597.1 MerR family mercuric resistance operon transcriptional regulator [Fonticella tunisiensis]
MEGLTIGQVAKGANVNIETIRYYEKMGLIPEPPRTESGYRLFSLEAIERIKFIKRAKELGFTLSEIKKLLDISDGQEFDCQDVQRFAFQKLKEIELKIHDLEKIKAILQDLSQKCPGQGPISECPILEELKEGGD